MARRSFFDPRQGELYPDLSALGRRSLHVTRSLKLPHRLFFVIRPPPYMLDPISRLAWDLSRSHDGRHPVPSSTFHLTVLGAGEFPTPPPDAYIEGLCRIGAAVVQPSFDISLDYVQAFNGKHQYPIVLRCTQGCSAVEALCAAIRAQFHGVSEEITPRKLNPHLTLWRSKSPMPERQLDQPLRWTVDKFCLVYSIFGESRHEELHHWDLQH